MPAPPHRTALLDPSDPAARAAWDDLLADSPQRTPFGTLAYAEAAASAFGLGLRLALAFHEDDRPGGGVLLFERLRGPLRTAAPPPLTPYTPPLLRTPPPEADVHARRTPLDALLPLLDREYHALSLHLPPPPPDVRPFTWGGYAALVRYTHAGPLPPPEELLQGASRNVRTVLAREGEGYRIEEDASAVPALEALMGGVYARQGGVPPVNPARRHALYPPLLAAGMARVFTATPPRAAEPEGVLVILTDGHSAHHWEGASRPGPAMTLLTLHAMGVMHAEGVRQFDLGGANLPPVAEFKRRFGLPLTPYVRVERYRNAGLRAAAAVRPFL